MYAFGSYGPAEGVDASGWVGIAPAGAVGGMAGVLIGVEAETDLLARLGVVVSLSANELAGAAE